MNAQSEIKLLMKNQLATTKAQNPSYSLRAFAKSLRIQPSAASELMHGRRRLTTKMGLKIVDGLRLPPDKKRSVQNKLIRQGKLKTEISYLVSEAYDLISEWYHFAILSLTKTRGFNGELGSIATRLGISKKEAALAVDRLRKLGLLSNDSEGKLVRTKKKLQTSDGVKNLALKKSHTQSMELARNSLWNDPVEKRDFFATTLTLDPDRLPEARQFIREFQDKFCDRMEQGSNTEVYKICVQLFPLTKSEKPNSGESNEA